MTNKNEMPLKNCPFKRGQVWENPDGEIMMVQHVRKTISGLHEVMYVTEDAEQGIFMEDCKEVVENIIMVDTRAAEPQPPVIEGLDDVLKKMEITPSYIGYPNERALILQAARLYAQGKGAADPSALCQAAQPVHSTQGTDFHRCNVEKTETGFRLCDGLHDKNEPCEWVLYEPKAQPVDLDAVKRESYTEGFKLGSNKLYRTNKSGCCCQFAEDDETIITLCMAHAQHLTSRGMIVTAQEGFDKLVEMLDREPQHKPRLAALLREHSVIDKQPTEDAQRALDAVNSCLSEWAFASLVGKRLMHHLYTIRAALARGLGE